jgi:hypothetical protein
MRKDSLMLIMPRLAIGAENFISMAFLVVSAEKIRRLLRIIFVTIFAWVYAWPWPGCLWMALRNILPARDNRIAGH